MFAVNSFKNDTFSLKLDQAINYFTVDKNDFSLKGIVTRVAQQAIAELGVSFCLIGVASFFVTGATAVATLVTTTVIMTGAGLIFKVLREKCREADFRTQKRAKSDNYTTAKHMADIGSAAILAHTDLSTRGILTHELGHKLAADALYANSRAKITLVPFKGGYTTYYTGKLSSWGERVGHTLARHITVAAGTTLQILGSTIDIIAAHKLQQSHKNLAFYLNMSAILNIASSVLYAFSALTVTSSKSHDFYYLWTVAKVHPLVAAGAIVVVPILVKAALCLFSPADKPVAIL